MNQNLKSYIRKLEEDWAENNLQAYLALLPDLMSNNAAVRELIEQKRILTVRVMSREKCLCDLYGINWRRKIAGSEFNSPQLRAYHIELRQLLLTEEHLSACDRAYEANFLILNQRFLHAQHNGGYPKQTESLNAAPYQSLLVQEFSGVWPASYRPSLEELIIFRQLAKNNMSHIGEAYILLDKTLKLTVAYVDTFAFKDLHSRLMLHPIDCSVLSKRLLQVYRIISGNPVIFGLDIVDIVIALEKEYPVQNLVNDILNGSRNELTESIGFTVTPQVLALIHLAQITSYLMAEGPIETDKGAQRLRRVFNTMLPDVELADGVIALVENILRNCTKVQLSKNINVYHSGQVMLNALVKEMETSGGLTARADLITSYLLRRQALNRMSTLANMSFDETKVGTMLCAKLGIQNWWKNVISNGKALPVTTYVVTAVSVFVCAAISALVTVDISRLGIFTTLGIESAALVALGFIVAKDLHLPLLTSNTFGMEGAVIRAEREKLCLRITLALEVLDKKALSEGVMGVGRLDKPLAFNKLLFDELMAELINVVPEKQAEAFSSLITNYANGQRIILIQEYTRFRQDIIGGALKHLGGIDVSTDALNHLMTEIDIALMFKE